MGAGSPFGLPGARSDLAIGGQDGSKLAANLQTKAGCLMPSLEDVEQLGVQRRVSAPPNGCMGVCKDIADGQLSQGVALWHVLYLEMELDIVYLADKLPAWFAKAST